MAEPTPLIPRDIRIEHIGLVAELQKEWADNLKARVKASMLEKSITAAAADHFTALLIPAGSAREVAAEAIFKLYEKGKLQRKELLSVLKVDIAALGKVMGDNQITDIATLKPRDASLRVSRIKGVEIQLVDAVGTIAKAIAK